MSNRLLVRLALASAICLNGFNSSVAESISSPSQSVEGNSTSDDADRVGSIREVHGKSHTRPTHSARPASAHAHARRHSTETTEPIASSPDDQTRSRRPGRNRRGTATVEHGDKPAESSAAPTSSEAPQPSAEDSMHSPAPLATSPAERQTRQEGADRAIASDPTNDRPPLQAIDPAKQAPETDDGGAAGSRTGSIGNQTPATVKAKPDPSESEERRAIESDSTREASPGAASSASRRDKAGSSASRTSPPQNPPIVERSTIAPEAPNPLPEQGADVPRPDVRERQSGPAPLPNVLQDRQTLAALHPNVLIILADLGVAGLSDLNHKSVVVAGLSAISQPEVDAALNAAGAGAAQLTEGTKDDAIDRLSRGQVSAAIIAFVTTEEANTYPDFPGFKLLRLPVTGSAAR